MSISTLAELKNAASTIVHRNIDEYFPTLIPLTESRLNRELKCPELEVRAKANISDSQVLLPPDYNRMIAVQIGDRVPLNATSHHMQDVYRQTHELLYSIYGNTIEIRPTIEDNVEVEIIYFKKLEPLVNDSGTNDILKTYPSVYLYSTLVDYSMLAYDERQNDWGELLMKELESIAAHYADSKYSGSPLRIRSAR
jgi:hypothetical protein